MDTKRLEEEIARSCGNMTALLVRKDGETRYERYFNGCGPEDAFHVFSVTKSVVSALMGIAAGRGLLGSLDRPVLDFFPEYVPKRGEKTIQTVTLRHLLTMTAPYKYRSAPYTKYFTSGDWVTSALDLLGGRSPAGTFRYAPLIGPDILSGVLERAAGMRVLEFAERNLFSPLGFAPKRPVTFPDKAAQMAWYRQPRYDGQWVADPRGVNTAGWGLTLTAEEMARLGQLYLDGGVWNGAQLLPAEWIAESTRPHSRWAEQGLDYGYLWWVVDRDCFAAVGDGGNLIYVNRKKRLVAACASRFRPRVFDRIAFVREQVEPLFED